MLCDAVKRAARTDDPSVSRAFTVFEVTSLPMATRPFSIWIQLTDGNGWLSMVLVIEHLPSRRLDPEVVVRVEFGLEFQDPNLVLEHVVAFDNGIELAKVGRYRARLAADGVTIAQRSFHVVLAA
ncbi:MAG TPA: hypothetical protein VFY71_00280 [Planctomycetota bacterium]|nr:hypothetical protein [Planctomycetota bacterium]